jgi:hypothetical protein
MKRLLVMAGLLVGLGLPQWSGAATIDDIRSADTVAIHEAVQSQLGALAETTHQAHSSSPHGKSAR